MQVDKEKEFKVILEVCIDSIESAKAAIAGGADRLEVCGNLGVGGGTTPSLGLVKTVARICDTATPKVQVMAMVRPRVGDFVYTNSEINVMQEDICEFAASGVHGVVFGVLLPDGTVDTENTRQLVDVAKEHGLEVCFHRAFDMCEKLETAFEDINNIVGIHRVLTSGGVRSAPEALGALSQLANRAKSTQTSIMVGSGLNHLTIGQVLRQLLPFGIREVHMSGGQWIESEAVFRKPDMGMGAGSDTEWKVWRTFEHSISKTKAVILSEVERYLRQRQ